MSYCRFGPDSDVFVYGTFIAGGECFICSMCTLLRDDDRVLETADDMTAHLLEHRAAGHKVPEYALERLRAE